MSRNQVVFCFCHFSSRIYFGLPKMFVVKLESWEVVYTFVCDNGITKYQTECVMSWWETELREGDKLTVRTTVYYVSSVSVSFLSPECLSAAHVLCCFIFLRAISSVRGMSSAHLGGFLPVLRYVLLLAVHSCFLSFSPQSLSSALCFFLALHSLPVPGTWCSLRLNRSTEACM